jgi:uncharacterized membrane protein
MSYTFYKLFHFVGIFLILISLGAIASHRLQGGTKANFKNRKMFMGFHGIGMLLSFIAGFGLIAKGGFSFANGWVYVKILVWLILGAYPVIFYKQKENSKLPLIGLFVALLTAIVFVEYKFF